MRASYTPVRQTASASSWLRPGTCRDRQRDVQHRRARLGRQPLGRDLDASAAQVIAQRFAHPGREEAVEMERRKVRHRGQGVEVERLIELPVDGFDHPVHATRVFRAAIAGRHAGPNK